MAPDRELLIAGAVQRWEELGEADATWALYRDGQELILQRDGQAASVDAADPIEALRDARLLVLRGDPQLYLQVADAALWERLPTAFEVAPGFADRVPAELRESADQFDCEYDLEMVGLWFAEAGYSTNPWGLLRTPQGDLVVPHDPDTLGAVTIAFSTLQVDSPMNSSYASWRLATWRGVWWSRSWNDDGMDTAFGRCWYDRDLDPKQAVETALDQGVDPWPGDWEDGDLAEDYDIGLPHDDPDEISALLKRHLPAGYPGVTVDGVWFERVDDRYAPATP